MKTLEWGDVDTLRHLLVRLHHQLTMEGFTQIANTVQESLDKLDDLILDMEDE